jgi:hypothetical protein
LKTALHSQTKLIFNASDLNADYLEVPSKSSRIRQHLAFESYFPNLNLAGFIKVGRFDDDTDSNTIHFVNAQACNYIVSRFTIEDDNGFQPTFSNPSETRSSIKMPLQFCRDKGGHCEQPYIRFTNSSLPMILSMVMEQELPTIEFLSTNPFGLRWDIRDNYFITIHLYKDPTTIYDGFSEGRSLNSSEITTLTDTFENYNRPFVKFVNDFESSVIKVKFTTTTKTHKNTLLQEPVLGLLFLFLAKMPNTEIF